MVYRLKVLDNAEHWQVFQDDKQIDKFLLLVEVLSTTFFEGSSSTRDEFCPNGVIDEGIFQLKGNHIPKGLVSLESQFDRYDALKSPSPPQGDINQSDYEKVNIGENEEPKCVNLGRCCTLEEKWIFFNLLKEYRDTFSWSYHDFKNFKG